MEWMFWLLQTLWDVAKLCMLSTKKIKTTQWHVISCNHLWSGDLVGTSNISVIIFWSLLFSGWCSGSQWLVKDRLPNHNWDQLVTPPYFAADEDLILAVSCKTNELRQPFGSSFEITEVAEAAAAEITGLFSQPVWITASPLTCSGLVKPEHQREKWFLGPGPSVTVVERMNLSPPLQHSLWFPRGL